MGDFLLQAVLTQPVLHWTLTTLREKLIKIEPETGDFEYHPPVKKTGFETSSHHPRCQTSVKPDFPTKRNPDFSRICLHIAILLSPAIQS
jgi:hypothetical protein